MRSLYQSLLYSQSRRHLAAAALLLPASERFAFGACDFDTDACRSPKSLLPALLDQVRPPQGQAWPLLLRPTPLAYRLSRDYYLRCQSEEPVGLGSVD